MFDFIRYVKSLVYTVVVLVVHLPVPTMIRTGRLGSQCCMYPVVHCAHYAHYAHCAHYAHY